jgi:hypothetical protein
MRKVVIIACLFSVFFASSLLCEDEVEINSQVMSVDPEKEYIIIKAGKEQGIEIGDGLIVHRDAEKIAEAQIIQVRPEVSAAAILGIEKEKEIREGDSIIIVKTVKAVRAAKKPTPIAKKPAPVKKIVAVKKHKWAPILGKKSEAQNIEPAETVSSSATYETTSTMPEKIQVRQEGEIVKIDIDTDANTAFSYALIVLRENGYSVILTNRATGLIQAVKPIEISLLGELWADAFAAIGHKLVASLEFKDRGGFTELSISSFKEHSQKGKYIQLPTTRDSKYYNELIGLAQKIKTRTEY